MGSNAGWDTRLEIYIYRSISPPTTYCAWCQDDYRPSPRAKLCLQSRKEPVNKKIIPKHLIQTCFIVAWRNVAVSLAKYNVYRYIGCIIDQSNRFGPFSLVVMTPIRNPEAVGSNPGFYLQVYFSSYSQLPITVE